MHPESNRLLLQLKVPPFSFKSWNERIREFRRLTIAPVRITLNIVKHLTIWKA